MYAQFAQSAHHRRRRRLSNSYNRAAVSRPALSSDESCLQTVTPLSILGATQLSPPRWSCYWFYVNAFTPSVGRAMPLFPFSATHTYLSRFHPHCTAFRFTVTYLPCLQPYLHYYSRVETKLSIYHSGSRVTMFICTASLCAATVYRYHYMHVGYTDDLSAHAVRFYI